MSKTMAPPKTLNKQALFRDLGYEPHHGQAEIHVSKASRRVVACGVRWGKSLCAAMEGLAAAMEPKERSMGLLVAPTYDLTDKIYREMVIIVAQHLRHRIVSMKDNEKRLIIRNLAGGLSEIRGKSADNPVSLLGEGLDWVIVDEGARLKPTIWEGHLSQRLLDKNGWALLISTPRSSRRSGHAFPSACSAKSTRASSWRARALSFGTCASARPASSPSRTGTSSTSAASTSRKSKITQFWSSSTATAAWSTPTASTRLIGRS